MEHGCRVFNGVIHYPRGVEGRMNAQAIAGGRDSNGKQHSKDR